MRYIRFAIVAALVVGACKSKVGAPPGKAPEPEARAPEKSGEITTSAQLVRQMHDRYSGKWYKTLYFEQKNTFYAAGKEQTSQWVQRLQVPGRLRVDFLPLSSKSGLLISNNRVTTFDNGRRVDSRRSIQPVLTMTADVYAIPATVTLRRLDSLGVDLDKFHDEKWQGRRMYVMGAEKGDLESTQVWVDADKFLLTRIIQRDKRGDRFIVTDTHVGDYREVDGYNVAFEYTSYRDGKVFFKEKYDNLKVNPPIAADVFDPTKWASSQAASAP